MRPYATAAADESGKGTRADRGGDARGRSDAEGTSDVAVRGGRDRDQSFGLTRGGGRDQGTDLTPFSFGE